MKQYKVVKTSAGKALKEMPAMEEPKPLSYSTMHTMSDLDWAAYNENIRFPYENHLSSLKKYDISKEHENSFELDAVIGEDEFVVAYCTDKFITEKMNGYVGEQQVAIPKNKEIKFDLFDDIVSRIREIITELYYENRVQLLKEAKFEFNKTIEEEKKKEAISILEWTLKESILPRDTIWFDAGKYYTSEQLYNLFKNKKHE